MISILDSNDVPKQLTIYDIAKEVGVSAATVSRAISGRGYVSEANKTRIMELVKIYNFRPNTFAQNLQAGFTKTIGYIVPHIGNMYFANVYYEFEKWASRHGYMTILLNSKGDYDLESKLLNSLQEKHVDGIVIMGGRMDEIHLPDNYVKEIQEVGKKVPMVSCGAEAERFGCSGIYTDDKKGVEELLQFLKSRGYHRILFTGGGDQYYPSYIKKKAAYTVGEKLGLDISVRWLTGNDVFSYSAGYDSFKILLEEKKPLPEVVCCINDYVALGVVNCALEAGLKIPDDLAVTGYDNASITTMTPVHITSISPRYEYYGKKVFNTIEKLIQAQGTVKAKTTLIKPEIIIRNSTK